VFGAGTIGLLSAHSCLLRGADVVYVAFDQRADGVIKAVLNP
jgi:threonine dehydrogenase-like Zn-dependent dehydrogenase